MPLPPTKYRLTDHQALSPRHAMRYVNRFALSYAKRSDSSPRGRITRPIMYAIIEDGGRQVRVEEGQEIEVDYREAARGDQLTFDRVLAYRDDEGIRVGQPTLEAATVTGEVIGAKLGPKIVVQKLRRRKNYRRKTGHRQLHTRVKIRISL